MTRERSNRKKKRSGTKRNQGGSRGNEEENPVPGAKGEKLPPKQSTDTRFPVDKGEARALEGEKPTPQMVLMAEQEETVSTESGVRKRKRSMDAASPGDSGEITRKDDKGAKEKKPAAKTNDDDIRAKQLKRHQGGSRGKEEKPVPVAKGKKLPPKQSTNALFPVDKGESRGGEGEKPAPQMVLTAKQEEVVNAEAGKKQKQSPEEDEGQSRGAKPLGTKHMEKSKAEIQVLPKDDNVDGEKKKKKGRKSRKTAKQKRQKNARAAQRNMFGV